MSLYSTLLAYPDSLVCVSRRFRYTVHFGDSRSSFFFGLLDCVSLFLSPSFVFLYFLVVWEASFSLLCVHAIHSTK